MNKEKLKKIFSYNVILTLILIGLIIMFGILIPKGRFFHPSILLGTTTDIVYLGIMAFPMTFIILTSGIDLSVGFLMTSTAMLFSTIYQATGNIFIAMLVALAAGLVFGALNGIIVANTKIPPFIATLGTMSIFQGITWFIGNSHSYASGNILVDIGNGKLFGIIPNQLVILIVVFVIFDILHERSSIGRYLHGIGYNEEAVEFSGVSIKRIKFIIYTLCGLMCALAGLLFLGRSFEINSTTAMNLNIEVITLVVLGGTSTAGGVGSMRSTLIATLIIGVLKKGLSLMGMSGDVYNFILGAVLVASLIAFAYLEKRKKIASRNMAIKNLNDSMDKAEEETPVSAVKS